MSGRPTTTCAWCHRECRSTRRVCEQCVGIATYPDHAPREDDALTGGEWRLDPRRRVLVWIQTEPEPLPIVHITRDVVCMTCDAGRTETCRTKAGVRIRDHVGRIRPRECECGSTNLKRGARWCETCARGRKNESKRTARREVAA